MTIFRVRFEVAGDHVHCHLFAAARPDTTYAKCGDFVVRKGVEFRDLLKAFDGAEFISENGKIGIVNACELGGTDAR